MATKTFTYEALDCAGALIARARSTPNSADAAANALTGQQLIPLSVPSSPAPGLQKDLKIPGFGEQDQPEGPGRPVPAVRLDDLLRADPAALAGDPGGADRQRPSLKAAVGQVRTRRRRTASTLSKAMSAHPDHFPLLMVNMVGAGETGGFLDDALDRIAKMYEATRSCGRRSSPR